MGLPSDNRLPKDDTTGIPIAQVQLYDKTEAGDVQPIGNSNPLTVANFALLTARGLIPGQELFEKFGRNPSISTTDDPQDVWGGGGLYTGQPLTAAEKVSVVSSSTSDDVGGTGLRSLRLFGQLAGVEQTEDVLLTGTTPALTLKDWDRIYRVRGLTAGTGGFNVGAITINQAVTTANVFSIVPVGTNRSQICAFTVPAGKRLYMSSLDARIIRANGGLGSGTVALMQRDDGGIWEQTHTTDVNTNGPADINLGLSANYGPLTDLVMRVLDVTDNSTSCTAQMFGILVDV